MMVEIAGRPSGIAATASEIETNSISMTPIPFRTVPTKKVTIATRIIALVRVLPRDSWSRCRGVSCFLVDDSILAIWPTSVSIPVPVTIPLPRP